MTKYNETTIVVNEGLSIKKNENSPFYQYHYRVNGKAYRKSTKTGDTRKAKKIALDAQQTTLYELEHGILSETITFNKLAQRYLKTIEDDKKHYFHEGTIRRHLKPFFSKFADIEKIKAHHLDEYIQSRKSKCETVSKSTLNKEHAVFNKMIAYAYKNEWTKKTLKFDRIKEQLNPRPYFTQSQLDVLIKTSKSRVNKYKKKNLKGKAKGLFTTKLWSRELVHDLIPFMTDTGLRPCELKTIKWKDVDWKTKSVKLHQAGKVKSSRRFYIRTPNGINALKRMQERRLEYAIRHHETFDDNEFIQAYPNGKKVCCLKKSFRSLVDACNFDYSDIQHKRHTMYSFRHTYATYALAGINGKKVPIRALSLQMGTSVRMIEQYYGHEALDDYIDFLVS
jgi:integrase